MRGFFAIGFDNISKGGNIGNLVRTAHSFGAAYCFSINAKIDPLTGKSVASHFVDTSKSWRNLPFYEYDSADQVQRPKGSRIVGIEITDDAVDLPSFHHPQQAIYILGSERYSLSQPTLALCDDVVKIPTKFSLNVATAGAVVMYDRMRMIGGFPDRPPRAGMQPVEKMHIHGKPRTRTLKNS